MRVNETIFRTSSLIFLFLAFIAKICGFDFQPISLHVKMIFPPPRARARLDWFDSIDIDPVTCTEHC